MAAGHPDAIVIGSDQVADLDGQPIGKPGTHARAVEQLRAMRGRSVVFQTAVAVVHASAGHLGEALVPVTVRFRRLDDAEIEHYLRTEQPYDCAGSARSEALGIALLDAIESDDPTALVGLPLIRTCAPPAGSRPGRARGRIGMTAAPGRLLLVPNALDFGVPESATELADALPLGTIRAAASLTHWAPRTRSPRAPS